MCKCDINPLKDYVKKSRGWFVCPKCGEDITLLVLFQYDAEQGLDELNKKKKLEKEKKNK